MKFTLSWLHEHLYTSASLDQISKTLTAIGLEVESVSNPAESLKAFTVAKILSADKHPEADKLRVCKVQSDAGELQIVCGAPNARAGIFVALAKEGAHIPGNGMVIKKTKIRGVESCGMLCSADELALGGDSAGIIELPEAPIGAPIADVLGLNDPVIEIAITPNRADCLGVRGIARDLAAAKLGTLKPLPDTSAIKGSFISPINVSIQDDKKCPQFIGAYIKGVKNGESPTWLKQRLEAIGQKSISTLVDITNYITFDLGRPLHVFDARKVSGNITVRDAKEGESFKALNGKDYVLKAGMTVVADEQAALGLGGVMGGESTGCLPDTTDVFLEVALFDPTHIAQTGRTLQIDSDARYRFERGIDVHFVETGALLAIRLIRELCGGDVSNLVITGKTPVWQRNFDLTAARIASLGGVTLATAEVARIFTALGFSHTATASGWEVAPPSWRADIDGEADLIEELLRIHGYEHIPATPLPKPASFTKTALTLAQKRVHLAKRGLAARGFLETCSWSFLSEKNAALFGGTNPALKLLNPIAADLSVMRPSLLPNLLDAASKNANRGVKDINLCEVGLQFHDITPDGQKMVACGIRSGAQSGFAHSKGNMKQDVRSVDAFDAKADALAVLMSLGLAKADITTQVPSYYHPGRSSALTLGGKIILGYFGELHPAIVQQFGLEQVVGFELFLEAIPAPRAKGKAKPTLKLSDYQAVERDFAFIVDEKVSAADIIKTINAAEKNLITSVELFDVYSGKGVDDGKKSVAIKVTLQSFERTLTDADITTVSQAIIAAAAKGFAGVLRG
ncbi:MAG: phenylalanine--tRNA ligase subunit beta [Rickettsiales bacterium]|nr:phenylalanine--tRNA ligase subunit beta [Rickettsiales bacterium]